MRIRRTDIRANMSKDDGKKREDDRPKYGSVNDDRRARDEDGEKERKGSLSRVRHAETISVWYSTSPR